MFASRHLQLQVKAAFTRAYNREVHLTPYSLLAVKKSRRGGGGEAEVGGEDVDNQTQESEDEGESLQTDAMIKVGGGGIRRGARFP